jgi:hypothetical protein
VGEGEAVKYTQTDNGNGTVTHTLEFTEFTSGTGYVGDNPDWIRRICAMCGVPSGALNPSSNNLVVGEATMVFAGWKHGPKAQD